MIWLFIIFPIPVFAIIAVAGLVEKDWRLNLNTTYQRYNNFKIAHDAYIKEKAEYDHRVATQQESYWRALSGVGFERELGKLFSRMGYLVTHTRATSDGGVDLILLKEGRKTVVQCKAQIGNVVIGVARELRAAMLDFNADDGIIACFDGVTKPVADYVSDKSIRVLTLREILALQRTHGSSPLRTE